jgi:acyl carrier protein
MDAKGLVRKYIEENMVLAGGELADDTPLLGVLDSVGIFEMMALVEQAFEIRVGDGELVPENFASLDAIQAYVERKLAGARAALQP